MKFINSLKVKFNEKLMRQTELLDKENLTDDEVTELKSLNDELVAMDAEIEELKKGEKFKAMEIAKAAAGGGVQKVNPDQKNLAKSFSLQRALGTLSRMQPLEGAEAELHQEGRAGSVDKNAVDGLTFSLPSWAVNFHGSQQRAGEVTVAGEGTDVVETELRDLIGILSPNIVLRDLGAIFLEGLSGNVQWPRHNGAATVAWEGEIDANAKATPTFNNLPLSPKRVGAYIQLSNQLMKQSSFGMEAFVRQELERVVALAFDSVGIQGGGTGEPDGILATTGIGAVSMGASTGGAPTWAKINEFIREVAVDDALMGNLAFLTNHKVDYKLKTTTKVDNSGAVDSVMLRDGVDLANNTLLGYRYALSNLVPSNLEEGASGTVLSAAIFGNFRDLILGQWGSIDLIVDPYTSAKNGMTEVVINMYGDVGVVHPESFAASVDIVTT